MIYDWDFNPLPLYFCFISPFVCLLSYISGKAGNGREHTLYTGPHTALTRAFFVISKEKWLNLVYLVSPSEEGRVSSFIVTFLSSAKRGNWKYFEETVKRNPVRNLRIYLYVHMYLCNVHTKIRARFQGLLSDFTPEIRIVEETNFVFKERNKNGIQDIGLGFLFPIYLTMKGRWPWFWYGVNILPSSVWSHLSDFRRSDPTLKIVTMGLLYNVCHIIEKKRPNMCFPSWHLTSFDFFVLFKYIF
jgi:hypothetical protein